MKLIDDFMEVRNWWDAGLIISLMFLMLVNEWFRIPMTETQMHVLFLLVSFYIFESLAMLCWSWTGLYEKKPDVVKSDEESKIVPIDFVKLFLGLPL